MFDFGTFSRHQRMLFVPDHSLFSSTRSFFDTDSDSDLDVYS